MIAIRIVALILALFGGAVATGAMVIAGTPALLQHMVDELWHKDGFRRSAQRLQTQLGTLAIVLAVVAVLLFRLAVGA